MTYKRKNRYCEALFACVVFGVLGLLPAVAHATRPWTPARTNTVLLWLDADDAASILTNASSVTDWQDKSGNGKHMVQAVGSAQPSNGVAVIGGLNAIAFGSDDFMETATLDHGTNFLLIGVWNTISGVSVLSIAGAQPLHWMNDVVAAPVPAGEFGFTTSGTNMYALDIDRTGENQVEIFKNGTGAIATNLTANIGDAEFRLNCGTAENYIGRNIFGEIIVSEDRSIESREMFEGYLAWKWGLVGSLPVGHTYKDKPPTVPDGMVIIIR